MKTSTTSLIGASVFVAVALSFVYWFNYQTVDFVAKFALDKKADLARFSYNSVVDQTLSGLSSNISILLTNKEFIGSIEKTRAGIINYRLQHSSQHNLSDALLKRYSIDINTAELSDTNRDYLPELRLISRHIQPFFESRSSVNKPGVAKNITSVQIWINDAEISDEDILNDSRSTNDAAANNNSSADVLSANNAAKPANNRLMALSHTASDVDTYPTPHLSPSPSITQPEHAIFLYTSSDNTSHLTLQVSQYDIWQEIASSLTNGNSLIGFDLHTGLIGYKVTMPIYSSTKKLLGAITLCIPLKQFVEEFAHGSQLGAAAILKTSSLNDLNNPLMTNTLIAKQVNGYVITSSSSALAEQIINQDWLPNSLESGKSAILNLSGADFLVSSIPLRNSIQLSKQELPSSGAILLWTDAHGQLRLLRQMQLKNFFITVLAILIIESVLIVLFLLAVRKIESNLREHQKNLKRIAKELHHEVSLRQSNQEELSYERIKNIITTKEGVVLESLYRQMISNLMANHSTSETVVRLQQCLTLLSSIEPNSLSKLIAPTNMSNSHNSNAILNTRSNINLKVSLNVDQNDSLVDTVEVRDCITTLVYALNQFRKSTQDNIKALDNITTGNIKTQDIKTRDIKTLGASDRPYNYFSLSEIIVVDNLPVNFQLITNRSAFIRMLLHLILHTSTDSTRIELHLNASNPPFLDISAVNDDSIETSRKIKHELTILEHQKNPWHFITELSATSLAISYNFTKLLQGELHYNYEESTRHSIYTCRLRSAS